MSPPRTAAAVVAGLAPVLRPTPHAPSHAHQAGDRPGPAGTAGPEQEAGACHPRDGRGRLLPNGPFSYVEKPNTKQTDKTDSLRYGYPCTSRHGPIRGYSITAYDWLARKHTVTVTASTSYWGKHQEQLKAVVDSFQPLGRGEPGDHQPRS